MTSWPEIARIWRGLEDLEREMWQRNHTEKAFGISPPRLKEWANAMTELMPPSLWTACLSTQVQLVMSVWEHIKV